MLHMCFSLTMIIKMHLRVLIKQQDTDLWYHAKLTNIEAFFSDREEPEYLKIALQ